MSGSKNRSTATHESDSNYLFLTNVGKIAFVLILNQIVCYLLTYLLTYTPTVYLQYLHAFTSLNGRMGLLTAVWLQANVRDRGLGLRPRLYVRSLGDYSAA